MSPLRLALLSLTRHKFVSFISILAISISVATSGILIRLYKVSEERFNSIAEAGTVIVGAKAGGVEIILSALNGEGKYPDFLPYNLYESLKSQKETYFEDGTISTPSYIKEVIPALYFAKFDESRILGTDINFFKANKISFKEGRFVMNKNEIVIGRDIALKKKLKLGNKILISPWLLDKNSAQDKEVTVVGILSKTNSYWDNILYSDAKFSQEILNDSFSNFKNSSIWRENVLHYFFVHMDSHDYQKLDELITKRTVGQMVIVDQAKETLRNLSGMGRAIGLVVCILIIFLGALCVCSMLVTRFEGMALQLAVLRAIGNTKKEIFKWLFFEGAILGMTGVVFGASLDAILFRSFDTLLSGALPIGLLKESSVWASYPVWLATILAVIISILIPMRRLSLLDAHTLLRGN